ncbi:MAG: polysaccharide deacetylase family protein [Pseudomonadota bacterium]
MYERDLRGYGGKPPAANWPNGARVAVSVVVNVEEGAEMAVSRGDARNEPVYDMIAAVDGVANIAAESHFDYGARAGYWRIMDLLAVHDVSATMSTCGEMAELAPWLLEDAKARGHEIAAHGYRWQNHAFMDEDEERRTIAETVSALEGVTGEAPLGWHTKTPASPNTRKLLIEHGGFLYDSDAYDDDLPRILRRPDGEPHVVVPYALDTNDMRFQLPNGFRRAEEFSGYVLDAFDWLWREGTKAPKMMSIGLHLRTIGRPARIGGLDQVLREMRRKGGVWFATRAAIAQHWLDQHG